MRHHDTIEYSANFSSDIINCTLYGCYEDEEELTYHVLPNSSCNYSLQEPTPLSTADFTDSTTDVLELSTVSTDSPNKGNLTSLLVTLVTVITVLLALILGLLSCYGVRVWKMRECRPINFQYNGPEVIQKFDPNFSPVKISAAISASLSKESVVNNMFVTESEETPTDTPDDYINTDEPSVWDSSSTGSYMDAYFLCSGAINSDSSPTDRNHT